MSRIHCLCFCFAHCKRYAPADAKQFIYFERPKQIIELANCLFVHVSVYCKTANGSVHDIMANLGSEASRYFILLPIIQ